LCAKEKQIKTHEKMRQKAPKILIASKMIMQP